MYCIPYLIHEIPHSELQQIWLFLDRNGTQLLQVESLDAALQMAADNGIPLAGPPTMKDGLILMPVDATSEELALFYTWSEINPGDLPMREVWRPFLWCKDAGWGLTQELQTVELGGGQTAGSVLSQIVAAA